MIAQLYRNSPASSESSLNTELDFLYQRESQLRMNLPKDDTGLRGISGRFRDLVYAPVAAKVLPVLMNFCLFGIPLEFMNLLFALFAYCCCYCSVFWRVNKSFSFLFSIHLMIHSVTLIWTYLGFSILYRTQEINYAIAQPDRFGKKYKEAKLFCFLGQYLSFSKHLFIFRPKAIAAMFVITVILMSVAPVAMYTYGYNKFIVNLFNVQYRNSLRFSSDINSHSGDYMDSRTKNAHEIRSLRLCCEGYAPHIIAILLLILIVTAKAPSIYALMVLYQHDNKSLFASCIIIDITYLFSWITFWLILTLKREWKYKVIYDVGEVISLQNAHKLFASTSALSAKDMTAVSKNVLIVMHGDQIYITDDHNTKQSILRHIQKNTSDCVNDDVYWLGANTHSPVRKNFISESAKGTPEMKRLLGGASSIRRSSNEENSTISAATYHTIARTDKFQKQQQLLQQKNDITSKRSLNFLPPEDINTIATFGTLQRIPRTEVSLLIGQQQQVATKQVAPKPSEYGIVSNVAETYATVHKPAQREPISTFTDDLKVASSTIGGEPGNSSSYSNFPNSYTSYGRISQKASLFNYGHSAKCPGLNVLLVNIIETIMSVDVWIILFYIQRYRPENSFTTTAETNGSTNKEFYNEVCTPKACREQHSSKRTSNLKLSSFNSCVTTPVGTSNQLNVSQTANNSTWTQQKSSATIQPLNLQWNENSTYTKTSSISTVSSQQEQSYTPSSTLTSQGSINNYSAQQLPIPGSPGLGLNSLYSNCGPSTKIGQRTNRAGSSIGAEDSASTDLYGTLTDRDGRGMVAVQQQQQQQRRVIAINNANSTGHDDSANYSLTSSNESAATATTVENRRNNDSSLPSIEYATSVV
uniref:Nucleoporin NDC1 n=1 Tax=Syphacia muris TaxID=451379 RepID=A0A0N5AF93_9BILA